MTAKTDHPKIEITSYEKFKARTMAIARGELVPGPNDPKIWSSSDAKPLADELLKVLRQENP